MSAINKLIRKAVNLTPGIKETAIWMYDRLAGMRYRKYVRTCPVNPHKVLFESYLGRKYSCSPRAMFEAMCQDTRYESYEKIWAFTDPEKHRFLEKQYPNTRVIGYRTEEYYRCYAEAGYWVTNYTLGPGIYKRPEQIYVQTWHGTPLKKIGCDVPRLGVSRAERRRTLKKYETEGTQINYMPSPSPFYTETVKKAFRLKEQGEMLELGYPRNDALFTTGEEEIARIRRELQIPEDKKVILYAPTWREKNHVAGEGYTCELGVDFEKLQEKLSDQAVILFRTHYFISSAFDFSKYGGFLRDVSNYDEINDLYLIADLLITDYSSVFFDYANLERPILFYMYDYEDYKEEMQDFYFDVSMLPGPMITKEQDISEEILTLLREFRVDDRYRCFNETFNPYRHACSRDVLVRIFP